MVLFIFFMLKEVILRILALALSFEWFIAVSYQSSDQFCSVQSTNHILIVPQENFPTLTHIVKLDLGKNQLRELPEYFGQLKNLRHLDLYSNQLDRLPVSFSQLKNLKWLDLKNNPLVPALQQAAGPCITASDCAMCAKKVKITLVCLLLQKWMTVSRRRTFSSEHNHLSCSYTKH